ncbi:MAG: trypsin-like peptidase domain-containing protein [Gemmataceae bacterium]|nr:trypsin-like peptidase domain-containing protein [Gemmataceae bacterium]
MASYYPEYPSPPRSRAPGVLTYWPWLFIFASLAFLVWYYWPSHKGAPSSLNLPLREPAPSEGYLPEEIATKKLYERAKPSVVGVSSFSVKRDRLTRNVYKIPEGTGSGFVWNHEGFLVTNYHVIQHADTAEVTMAGKTWKAHVWGVAPDQDLAVLWIDVPAAELTPIAIGVSKDLWVGQHVFALGNPFGLDYSLSSGIISALGREIESGNGRTIGNVIQTDASINPGNSGGPLLDSSGRMIGVNTAIYSPSGASAGIGFAIPVDTVNRVVTELVNKKKAVRPGLGIQVSSDRDIRENKLPGIPIRNVLRTGAAAKGGLRAGDIIVALDDKPVTTTEELFSRVSRLQVGDRVKVTVLRDNERQSFDITLEGI